MQEPHFLATHVGNCIQITAGTNFVVGIYRITAFGGTNSITVDRPPATAGAGSAGNGNLGGALATLSTTTGLGLYQEGTTIAYIKATANYAPAANLVQPAGIPTSPTIWRGFTTSITDNGSATIAPTAATIITSEGYGVIENFIIDGGASSFFTDLAIANAGNLVSNVVFNHFSAEAISGAGTFVNVSCREWEGRMYRWVSHSYSWRNLHRGNRNC